MSLSRRQLRTLRVIECGLADSDPYLNAYFRSFAKRAGTCAMPRAERIPPWPLRMLGRRRGRTRSGAVKDWSAGNRPDP